MVRGIPRAPQRSGMARPCRRRSRSSGPCGSSGRLPWAGAVRLLRFTLGCRAGLASHRCDLFGPKHRLLALAGVAILGTEEWQRMDAEVMHLEPNGETFVFFLPVLWLSNLRESLKL